MLSSHNLDFFPFCCWKEWKKVLKIRRSGLQLKDLPLLWSKITHFVSFPLLYFVKQKGPDSRMVAKFGLAKKED